MALRPNAPAPKCPRVQMPPAPKWHCAQMPPRPKVGFRVKQLVSKGKGPGQRVQAHIVWVILNWRPITIINHE